MKDQDTFENLLTLLKSLCNIFQSASMESSNDEVAETFREVLDEALAVQHDLYKIMESAGFYQVEQVPAEQINALQDKFVNYTWQ